MFFALSRRFSRLNCVLALVASNLVASIPLPPQRRSPESRQNDTESGFSTDPKVLEIQLPLKVASKEDLVSWAKYVMSLMASRINITLSSLKEPSSKPVERPEIMQSTPMLTPTRSFSSLNFPGPRMKQDSVTQDRHKLMLDEDTSRSKEPSFLDRGLHPSPLEMTRIRDPFEDLAPIRIRDDKNSFLPQYPDFGTRPNFDENEIFRNANVLTPPPGTYLPLPLKITDGPRYIDEEFVTRSLFDATDRTLLDDFAILSPEVSAVTKRTSVVGQEAKQMEPTPKRNVSSVLKPILTLPFEAIITITRDDAPQATTFRYDNKDYFVVPTRDPPDEFPPYFDTNYTLANDAGKISVSFSDGPDLGKGEEMRQEEDKGEMKRQKVKKQQSRKKQSAALLELLRLLGMNRKGNSTEVNVPPPAQMIFAGQNAQISEREPPMRQAKRNESHAQELQEDDYDYDDEDNMGGSLQQLVELLPLVLPILEDISDPTTETDIGELLGAAIPLLQGLSEGDEEGGVPDLAGFIVPILLNIIGGPDGQGSDVNSILGPLIQLLAPLIGPIVGPLIGPLSQQSSNTPQEGGSSLSTLVQAIVGPLSQPTGPGYMSPFSTLIAGVIASLSKELTNGESGLDLSSLVKAVVSGFLAGTSAGLSGKKDTAMAPTSYGGYGGYGGYGPVQASGVNPLALIQSSIKDILSAGLKVASSLITALAGILGASSAQPSPPYGPPPSYGAPPTAAPYATNARPPPRNTRFTKF